MAAPAIVEGSAVVIPTAGTGTDTVIRPEYNGAYMFTSIRDDSAPEQYEWHIKLNPGQYLVQHDEAHIQVMAKTGAEAWLISANHARDATGETVPTSVEIIGGSDIVFKIPHRNHGFVYPISAGEAYETSYAVVTADLQEEEVEEEGIIEVEEENDEEGPEPDGVEPYPSGTQLTDSQAAYLVHGGRFAHPAVVPAPRPRNQNTIESLLYRSKCGPTCGKWNAKVYNATILTRIESDPYQTPVSTWWEGGTEIHAKVDQDLSWSFLIWPTTWNCGTTGPSKVLYGSQEHLTAYAHYTIESWVGARTYPKEVNLTLFAWVYPNGFQQRHVNMHWSGQPADHTCPRVAAEY